ncbi:MAG: chromosomal replication initiator protein DnaA [Clostridia bacterium]|jgi:chromosomal replication initiator protein|nr:chromosomal replication initiator protein DnaA [Clostridia bacterium]MBQ4244271.1 chromosomal replication initiator protein DnaA [Clostridia bacterium]
MKTANELWENVQQEIKNNFSETVYNVWLSNMSLVSFDGEKAVIATDEFRIKIIMQKFMDNIKAAFETVTGFDVDVEFVNAEAEPAAQNSTPYDDASDDEEATFETFVVGPSNRFAYVAAMAVAEKPGVSKNYNPLFIYGNSGLGKTHLLHAIGHKAQELNPDLTVIYISGEEFINIIVENMRNKTMSSIHEKFRNVDVLLVDDVQFFAKKEQTQVEFFHTFDALINDRKQIVLSSDRPPKELKEIDERLKTRFEWGLLADIEAPDLETRMAIINRKAKAIELELPNDVVEYLAENIKNNVRQLEGAVKNLKAYSTIHGVSINLATAQGAVKDILTGGTPTPVTVEKIINEVARAYGADPDEIRSKKKDAKTAKMRQISMYIIRDMTNLSLENIGREFSDRDHTTVMHAIDVINRAIATDSNLENEIADIKKNVGE